MTGSNLGSYLLATWEGGGSVAPFITIARQLVERGHSVRVMSDVCNRQEVEAVGATFVPWVSVPARPTRDREFDVIKDWTTPDAFEGFCMLIDEVLVGRAGDHAADICAELLREPADLVVVNEMILGAQLGCEAVGQRHVTVGCNILLFPIEPAIPPLGPGLLPAVTPEDQVLHAQIRAETMAAFDARLGVYNAIRAEFGLAPLDHLVDQLFSGEKLLLATTRAFDFAPAQMNPFIEYVGPQLDDNRWSRAWEPPFAQGDTRPLVLVGFSTTFQNHADCLQRTIDAIAGLPVRAVVTLGGSIRPEEITPAPNTVVVDSAPHHLLMQDAALVVTHGGHGTVSKTLVHGLPMLVIPHGRDQVDNAARVTHRGAGLAVDSSASVAKLRVALERLLNEPGFTASAVALGQRIRNEAAGYCVASRLEELTWVENCQAA